MPGNSRGHVNVSKSSCGQVSQLIVTYSTRSRKIPQGPLEEYQDPPPIPPTRPQP